MYVWLQFLKTILCSQNIRRIKKTGEHFNLVPSFVCFEKHIEPKTLNLNDKNSFQKNTKMMFFVFSKVVLKTNFQNSVLCVFKNSFKRHEPNMPISLFLF